MHFSRVSLRVLAAAAMILSFAQAATAQNPCGSATDDDPVSLRNSLAVALSGKTAFDVQYRTALDLPNVADSAVAIVQDTTVCRQAQKALVQAWGSGSVTDPVYVLRISNTHYLVYNNRQMSAGRTYGLLFTPAFVYIRSLLI